LMAARRGDVVAAMLSSSQGGAGRRPSRRPWDPCLNGGAGRRFRMWLRMASMAPLRWGKRSGMDPRVKPEDDEVEGAAALGWGGEALRSLPARSDEEFVPVRVGFLDQFDLPLSRPALE